MPPSRTRSRPALPNRPPWSASAASVVAAHARSKKRATLVARAWLRHRYTDYDDRLFDGELEGDGYLDELASREVRANAQHQVDDSLARHRESLTARAHHTEDLSQVADSVMAVVHNAVPADTDPAVLALLVDRWRDLSLDDRAAMVEKLCRDVELLARVEITARHPDFAEVQILHELARRRYGTTLADAAYETLLGR
jgi:hypothetical protein